MPNPQSFNAAPFNMQKFQPPFVHYESVFPHPAQLPAPPLNYRTPVTPVMSPYCAMGLNHTSRDALYMQWPTQSMMYAQSYDQLRQACFQVGLTFHFKLSRYFASEHIITNLASLAGPLLSAAAKF